MPKPIGVSIIGLLLMPSGVTSIGAALIAVSVLGQIEAPYVWVVGLALVLLPIFGFFAIKAGRGLLSTPATNRLAGERVVWACIPFIWISLALIITLWEIGIDGLTVALGVGTALFWSIPLIGIALYMRSKRVREYFDQAVAPGSGAGQLPVRDSSQ